MKKFILSIIIILCLNHVYAQEIEYLAYNTATKSFETKTISSATEITSTTTTISNGWYVVNNNITISGSLTINGNVSLILKDGYTLTVTDGVKVASSNELTIYTSSNNTGKLIATGNNEAGSAGIGGVAWNSSGTITINGGTIEATGANGGAGIGSGHGGTSTGKITINGGNITATGGACGSIGAGAGIGSGYQSNNYEIIITNGIITANGATQGETSASIGSGTTGGGSGGNAGNITITGGQITAGIIGHGSGGSGGNIIIGWTNENDFISAQRYWGENISIAEGQAVLIDDSNSPQTIVSEENINGKKLTPPKPSITKLPTIKNGLIYNGSEQELINDDAVVTNGKLLYSVDDAQGEYLERIPTAQSFGNHIVYYMIKSTSTMYSDISNTEGMSFTVNIAQTQPYVIIEGTTLTFKYGVKPDGAYDVNSQTNTPAWHDDAINVTKVVFDESFADARPTSCIQWFKDMTELSEFEGLSNLNTSEVTNMGLMFTGCAKLTVLDLSSFDTRNVVKANDMFEACTNLTTIKVGSNWTTTKMTGTTENMFNGCTSLIGNDGTTVGTTLDTTYAHADKGGYLTKGDYKIFYQWADDDTKTYHEHTPSTFSGKAAVTLDNPERDGYKFDYWKRVSPGGGVIGESSSTVTIAAGDLGNRIYQLHWTIVHTVSFYNGTTFISSVEVPHGEKLSEDQYPKPEKEGHILQKWTLTDAPDANGWAYTVDEDINLYAQWFKDKFFVWIPEHFEYITSNDDDDMFEYDSEVQFKISEGYITSKVYYTLGENTEQIPLTPNSEGVYTYKVQANIARFYSDTKEFYTMKLGKNASANLPFTPTSATAINFTCENSEISVSENRIVTTNNVTKGDVCTLTSNNHKIEITIIDPFENFFDENKWYNQDVVFSCPDNDDNWTLQTENSENNTIHEEGENNVACKILDSDNNIITKESFVVKIDKTAPEFSLKIKNTEKSYDIPFKEYLAGNYFLRSGYNAIAESSDDLSGVKNIEYSLDKTNFINYNNTPIELSNGKNMLYFRAKDLAGNSSEIYTTEFSVFQESKFAENLETEITSDSIFYSSESIADMSFKINLNGNTIGKITDTINNILDFPVTENIIKINKEYLETLTPGNNKLLVHINPLGLDEAWDQNLNPADFESQILTINLDVEFVVKPTKKYNFVMETDTSIKAFCQGDNLYMAFEFNKAYSLADYISIETLGIDKENPLDGIRFTVPIDALTGGNEKLPIIFFKDSYEYQDTVIFPADYPSERNIRLYDDVLALDNSGEPFVDGAYKWYMDGKEIEGENKQFIDLQPYLNNKEQHIFFASVLNTEGERFRVCPNEDFNISLSKKYATAKVKTYPNPVLSGQEINILIENITQEDLSKTEILIYDKLGSLVKKISNPQEINSVIFKEGFYSGIITLKDKKILNFKFIVN